MFVGRTETNAIKIDMKRILTILCLCAVIPLQAATALRMLLDRATPPEQPPPGPIAPIVPLAQTCLLALAGGAA